MTAFFVLAVIVLVFLVIFQIAKASEYVSVLKGEERAHKQNNRINGFFMIAFLLAGLIGVYLCNEALVGKTLLVHEASSVQGEKVDQMLENVIKAGGKESRKPQDHGWMYGRSFEDLNGHIWEIIYMDEKALKENYGQEQGKSS